jgi:hypothetical protein
VLILFADKRFSDLSSSIKVYSSETRRFINLSVESKRNRLNKIRV